jgi:hypothetical protein
VSDHLDAYLISRAHVEGRAQRTALLRHRHLVRTPLALVLWQLGAEPFSAAAVGYGSMPDGLGFGVAGDPRNRDLAFTCLRPLALWFNQRFERPAEERERVQRGSYEYERATSMPQVVVPNAATIALIGRLGRRLAYLTADERFTPDPELIRLGQHFLFLERHALRPGQQIVVPLTELLRNHWATAQTDLERGSLAALDAFIEPPPGVHGFDAAAAAELENVGPLPDGDDDTAVEPLVREFNASRAGRADANTVGQLLAPITAHYRPLVERSWSLLWRCLERERAYPEAPSCARRLLGDREAYTQHVDWTLTVGWRRTRQTARQAASTMRELEGAQALLEAEEAVDDPLRMARCLLAGKALAGIVVAVDREHREIVTTNRARRPLVTLECPERCRLPRGRTLYWSDNAGGTAWEVHDVANNGGGSVVTMKLLTSTRDAAAPEIGDYACFSIHSAKEPFRMRLPRDTPWTHAPAAPPAPPAPIEDAAMEVA